MQAALHSRPLASVSSIAGAPLVTARRVAGPRPTGPARCVVVLASAATPTAAPAAVDAGDRMRLHNIAPQPGSRPAGKRKGRGHAAGQGASCGFGMRGQKSRAGSGVRPGFEGGQTPLYRRMPKLKGIAGGMAAGVPRFVTVNVGQLEAECDTGAAVDAASLGRLVEATGAAGKLPLKVLGAGELTKPLTVSAAAFSASAAAKIEAAGGKAVVVPVKAKWTRPDRKAVKAAAAVAAAAEGGGEAAPAE